MYRPTLKSPHHKIRFEGADILYDMSKARYLKLSLSGGRWCKVWAALFRTKAFPLLKLIMTNAGWVAVSTILKIQIRVCYYWAKSAGSVNSIDKCLLTDNTMLIGFNFSTAQNVETWIIVTQFVGCSYKIGGVIDADLSSISLPLLSWRINRFRSNRTFLKDFKKIDLTLR